MTHPAFGWLGKRAGNRPPWPSAFSVLLPGYILDATTRRCSGKPSGDLGNKL